MIIYKFDHAPHPNSNPAADDVLVVAVPEGIVDVVEGVPKRPLCNIHYLILL